MNEIRALVEGLLHLVEILLHLMRSIAALPLEIQPTITDFIIEMLKGFKR